MGRGIDADPERFGEFYDRYRDVLLAYFARRVGEPEVAADLMAETFAKALLALHGGAEVGAPAAWLFAIGRTTLVDSVRRGQVEVAARRRLSLEPIALDDTDIERVVSL